MELSSDLISQFVKTTNDRGAAPNEIIVHGVVVTDGEQNYVQLDGSSELAPIESTVEISPGDRVIVAVKNHAATVTGNTTDPSIGTKTADGLRSSITQTAADIRMEVADEVNTLNSSLELTAQEIRSEVNDMNTSLSSSITQNANNITSLVKEAGEFSEFQQTVEGFLFKDESGEYVAINDGSIKLTGALKFADLPDSANVTSDINNALYQAQQANSAASAAGSTASQAITTISGLTITSGATTYIDGSMIYSNSVYADKIHLGGQMTVYQSMYSNAVGGYLGYCSGYNSNTGIGIMSSTSTGQCICTDLAARMSYGGMAHVVCAPNGVTLDADSAIFFEINNVPMVCIDYAFFRPYSSATTMNLGSSVAPWSAVYSSTDPIVTSDRNKKNSIEDLPEKYIAMYEQLQPKRFKLNNGTSGRYHVGYIAQDVEDAMLAAGIDSQEFGGLVKDKDEDGNDIYLLRYGEFDAIRDAKIKKLEEENRELKARIEAIEKLLTQ